MRCRRLRATNTDPRRPRGGLRTANRRIPLAWLPSDAPAPQGREAANFYWSRRCRACGKTYSRRRLSPVLDHDASRIPTSATTASSGPRTQKHPLFTPQFSRYRSLWTTNEPNGPQTSLSGASRAGSSKCRSSIFLGTYLIKSLGHKREPCSYFHLLTARVLLPRRPTRIP